MKLDKRRRIEQKTNYTKRLKLLEGNSPRLVIRKTNKYIIMQIIQSIHAQDKVIYSVNTKELLKHNWPKDKEGSLKSLTACYLGGILLAKKAKELKSRVVLDTGLVPSTKGSRIYACVKGYSDGEGEINYDSEIVPTMEMITGDKEKILKEVMNVLGKELKASVKTEKKKETLKDNKKIGGKSK